MTYSARRVASPSATRLAGAIGSDHRGDAERLVTELIHRFGHRQVAIKVLLGQAAQVCRPPRGMRASGQVAVGFHVHRLAIATDPAIRPRT